MNELVDQFGRNKSKTLVDPINENKSKKILDALAEIKNQLGNKNQKLNSDVNIQITNQDIKSIKAQNLDFDQLHKKIISLEEKLINLSSIINSHNLKTEYDKEKIHEVEKSIFHNFNNEATLEKGKSLLVLEEQQQSNLYKFKFYHFISLTILMIMVLIMLTSFKLSLNFLEVINILIN